jgi:glycosyltransferase involved in cell wall biosynthesis
VTGSDRDPRDRPRTVIHLITTLSQGGAERVLSQVVPRPDEHRDERHLVVSLVPGGMFADELIAAGVEVRDLGMRPGRDVTRGTLRLARLLRAVRPQMVVSWMYHASLLDLLARPFAGPSRRARMVWMVRGSLHSLAGLPWHTRSTVRLLALFSKRPEAITTNSRTGRLHHARVGYRPRGWILLPNGCDTEEFLPDDDDRTVVRRALGIPPDATVAICVARNHPQKDHATLLTAAATAGRSGIGTSGALELVLVGSGTEALSDGGRAGLRVHGLGERRDVRTLLRAADLIVSSSLTEGLPNALLEGMASGLVPIATDVGDCRDVIGETGRVVPPADVEGLAAALSDMLHMDHAERSELGRRARDRVVERYDADLARREYRGLWAEAPDGAAAEEASASRPLRVVHIIARMNVGGPARILAGLLDELDPDRYPQTLLTGSVGPGEEDWFVVRQADRAADARIVRLGDLGRAIDPLRDLRTARRLTRLLEELAPDVVQTHTAKAGLLGRLAARRAGVPVVIHTFHGHTLHGYFSRPVTAMFTLLERRLARRTDVLLAVGARVRDELLSAGIGTPDQYVVLPPGIPLEAPADRDTSRRALGIGTPTTPVVAFVGRLSPVKRPDRFLEAAEQVSLQHPDAVFLIVGDGELRSELEERAIEADVRFLGWRGDVDVIYAAADVLVVTSDNEGMPVTLIEASAAGCPCVTTDVGSASEVVLDGRTGLVVPCEAGAVADAVSRLLRDAPLRGAFGQAAKEHALREFGLGATADLLTEVYRRGAAATRR